MEFVYSVLLLLKVEKWNHWLDIVKVKVVYGSIE